MTTTSPGFYDDGNGRQRYWDGTQWTDQYQDTPPRPAAVAQSAAPVSPATIGYASGARPGKGLWMSGAIVGGLGVVLIIIAIALSASMASVQGAFATVMGGGASFVWAGVCWVFGPLLLVLGLILFLVGLFQYNRSAGPRPAVAQVYPPYPPNAQP